MIGSFPKSFLTTFFNFLSLNLVGTKCVKTSFLHLVSFAILPTKDDGVSYAFTLCNVVAYTKHVKSIHI